MQIATVVGTATATIKHDSLKGWKLVLIQPLQKNGGGDGEPMLAIDHLGSSIGSNVIITSEGGAVRDIMKRKDSPVRWMVMGLCDS